MWFLTDQFLVLSYKAYVHITGELKMLHIFAYVGVHSLHTKIHLYRRNTLGKPWVFFCLLSSSIWASPQQHPGFCWISGLGADMLLGAFHPFSSPLRKLAQSLGDLLKVPEPPCSPRLEHLLHTLPACRDYSHFSITRLFFSTRKNCKFGKVFFLCVFFFFPLSLLLEVRRQICCFLMKNIPRNNIKRGKRTHFAQWCDDNLIKGFAWKKKTLRHALQASTWDYACEETLGIGKWNQLKSPLGII